MIAVVYNGLRVYSRLKSGNGLRTVSWFMVGSGFRVSSNLRTGNGLRTGSGFRVGSGFIHRF